MFSNWVVSPSKQWLCCKAFIPCFPSSANPSLRSPSDKCYFSPMQTGTANHIVIMLHKIWDKLKDNFFVTVFPFFYWASNCKGQSNYEGAGMTRKIHSAEWWLLDTWWNSELRLQPDITYIPCLKITKNQRIPLVKQNYFPEPWRVKKSQYRCGNRVTHPCTQYLAQ